MNSEKFHRLVFVGSFGECFLWYLVMILGIIPILGSYFQFLFLKWVIRNTVLFPFEVPGEELQSVIESHTAKERIQGELGKIRPLAGNYGGGR